MPHLDCGPYRVAPCILAGPEARSLRPSAHRASANEPYCPSVGPPPRHPIEPVKGTLTERDSFRARRKKCSLHTRIRASSLFSCTRSNDTCAEFQRDMRQFALLPLIRRHLGANSASAILGEAGSHPPKTQRDPPFALIRAVCFPVSDLPGLAGGRAVTLLRGQ